MKAERCCYVNSVKCMMLPAKTEWAHSVCSLVVHCILVKKTFSIVEYKTDYHAYGYMEPKVRKQEQEV